MNNAQKIRELEKKLEVAEAKYKARLSRFRGVPHESAAGELSYSELKVAEDFVNSIKREIAVLKGEVKGTFKNGAR